MSSGWAPMWVLTRLTLPASVVGVSREMFPHMALSAHAHNRLGLQRTDNAWLDQQMSDPSTRVLVVAGTRVRHRDGTVVWDSPAQAPEGSRVLLGERDGVVHLAVIISPEEAAGDPEEWVPLRGVLPDLARHTDQAPLLFHALGLAEWHHATRFCPRCGGGLESRAAGHELRCTTCDRPQFPRTDPAVIMAVTHDDSILLGRQASWPASRWSTLAGFCEPGETLEDAVRREVLEEVGLEVGEVTYFGNQPWPLPASLMVGFVAQATTTEIHVDGAEIEAARWWTREEFVAESRTGNLLVPRGVSISSSLIEDWLGQPLKSGWA